MVGVDVVLRRAFLGAAVGECPLQVGVRGFLSEIFWALTGQWYVDPEALRTCASDAAMLHSRPILLATVFQLEPEPRLRCRPSLLRNNCLWGVSMTTNINAADGERTFERVAQEQFDAFEKQEGRLRTEERAARAAQLKLPVQLSTRIREHRESWLRNGRRPA